MHVSDGPATAIRTLAGRGLLLVFLLLALPWAATPGQAESVTRQEALEVFVRAGCPHCASAKAYLPTLASQRPGGSAFVIGETGLTNALYEAGFSMNDVNPDYVVMGDFLFAKQDQPSWAEQKDWRDEFQLD